MNLSSSSVASVFLFAVVIVGATTAAEIPAGNTLADVPQSFSGIIVGPDCPKNGTKADGGLPRTMFTIVPGGSAVEVLTEPANLFSTYTDTAGNLKFEWNADAASNAGKESGVKVTMPADQLRSVTVEQGIQTNILNGFTGLNTITVSGGSPVTADLTSNVGDVSLDVSGGAPVTVASGGVVPKLSVSGGSSVTVGATSVTAVDISGGSSVNIKGDVAGGSISGGSPVLIDGSVTGSLDASGGSPIDATSCGSITTSGGSQCSDSSPTVGVPVLGLSSASETTDAGNWGFDGCGGGFWNDVGDVFSGAGSSNTAAYTTVAIATAVLTIGATTIF